jgi:cation-transporting ATPase E
MDVQAVQAPVVGLTGAEAEARRRRGEANTAVGGTSRTYATILRTNVFSFYNTILFVIGVALLALGHSSDALITVGLGLINAMISAAQEIRAKRKLDRLQLLDQAQVLVVRDGRDVEIAPDAVVRGDVLRVRPGDQIVVDGPLLDGGRIEADESLLTGESDPVVKDSGDDLRSGSLCVAGEATSSPATSARTATPDGSPPRPARPPPTRRHCSGASSSSSDSSLRWSC